MNKVIKLNGLVYITSEEVINYNEYFISFISDEVQIEKENPYKLKLSKELYKKIILTNDPKLTTVQQLTQEEVEYCMGVDEVKVERKTIFDGFLDPQIGSPKYKFKYKLQLPKQETIEEVADMYSTNEKNCHPADSYIYKKGFLKGYNHAVKTLYTKEEVKEMLFEALNEEKGKCCVTNTTDSIVRKVINQNKKK